MRRRLGTARRRLPAMVITAVIVVSLVAAVRSMDTRHDPPRRAQSSTRRTNRQAADAIATHMGDRHPGEIEVATATRAVALHTLFPGEVITGGGPPDLPVRIFAMHGRFVDHGPIPPGEREPRGTWLIVVVDTATGAMLDLSLGDTRPDLRPLGPVRYLSTQ